MSSTNASDRLTSLRQNPTALAITLFAVLIVINIILQPSFVSPGILFSNLATFLPLMIVSLGQAYVIQGGSIDLSLGAVISLVNVIVVVVAEQISGTGGVLLGMGLGLGAGLACGLVNGVLIAVFRLQAIVTTFATSIVIGGLALKVLPQAGGLLPAGYYLTYGGPLLGIPFVIWLLVSIIAWVFWMARRPFGVHLLAVGANRYGAFQTGLPVAWVRVKSHIVAGGLAALAAFCILGLTGAGDPLMGQDFTLGSVSAVVLGGIALSGGWGHAGGALLGGAIISLINNVIFFAQIPYQFQSILQGAIVLAALAAGIFVSRKPG